MRSSLPAWVLVLLAACSAPGLPPTDDTDDPAVDTDTNDTETDLDTEGPTPPEVVRLPVETCVVDAWGKQDLTGPPLDGSMTRDLVGGAVAVLDLDHDGDREVVVAGPTTLDVWSDDPEAGWVRTRAWTVDLPLSEVTSLGVIDLDDDGWHELVVTRWRAPTVVLRSTGAPPLVDVTPPSLAAVSGPFLGTTWTDLDGDGDLDVFFAGYGERPEDAQSPNDVTALGEPSALLYRLDDGTFTDRSADLPDAVQTAHVFGALGLDLDLDGRSELLTVHDFGWVHPGQLLWSRPQGLVPDDGSAGWSIRFAGMGAAVADLDGDGAPDIVQSSWKDTSLLVARDGVWYEAATVRGLVPDVLPPRSQFFGWGTVFSDLDRDGRLDVAVAFGHWDAWGGVEAQRDGLWLQQGDGTFTDEAATHGLDDPGATRGLVAVDLDGDGGLELVARRPRSGSTIVHAPCPTSGWLSVRLVQPGSNRDAVGARVRVWKDGKARTGWVLAGTHGLFGSVPPELDFGLGDVTTVDRLEIRWPDGRTDLVGPVDVPARLEIRRPTEE